MDFRACVSARNLITHVRLLVSPPSRSCASFVLLLVLVAWVRYILYGRGDDINIYTPHATPALPLFSHLDHRRWISSCLYCVSRSFIAPRVIVLSRTWLRGCAGKMDLRSCRRCDFLVMGFGGDRRLRCIVYLYLWKTCRVHRMRMFPSSPSWPLEMNIFAGSFCRFSILVRVDACWHCC